MGGEKPEGRVEGQPAGKTAEPEAPVVARTVTPADLKAAAERARSEGERTQASADAAPVAGGPPNDGKQAGDATATSGTEAGKEAALAGKPAEPPKPEAPPETTPKDGKDAKGDPLPDDDPFWKTSLGRKVSTILKNTAEVTEELAHLKAKMSLIESGKAKPAAAPKAPSEEEAALEKELGLEDIEGGDKTAAGKGGDKVVDDPKAAQARYQLAYLENFAVEEYKSHPRIAEIKALMLNKDDPANTYNRPWFGHPRADFDKNFSNAARFLEGKEREAAGPTPPPDAGKIKGEPVTAPLGVGGDTRGTDTRTPATPKLDEHAQKLVSHIKSRGRDAEAIVKKAFAVDTHGAARSGT